MPGFATGYFDNPTRPGFWLENTKYRIQFQGVPFPQNMVGNGFQGFQFQFQNYNWGEVANLLLHAIETANNDRTEDMEDAAEEALRKWLTSDNIPRVETPVQHSPSSCYQAHRAPIPG